jgi:hypothetical protein
LAEGLPPVLLYIACLPTFGTGKTPVTHSSIWLALDFFSIAGS